MFIEVAHREAFDVSGALDFVCILVVAELYRLQAVVYIRRHARYGEFLGPRIPYIYLGKLDIFLFPWPRSQTGSVDRKFVFHVFVSDNLTYF